MKSKPIQKVPPKVTKEAIQQGSAKEDRRRKVIDLLKESYKTNLSHRANKLDRILRDGEALSAQKEFEARVRAKVRDTIDPIFAEDENTVRAVADVFAGAATHDKKLRKKLFPSEE